MAFNMNLMQFLQFVKKNPNPQQLMINMLQQQSKNNPILSNLLQMAESGEKQQIEDVVRNIFKERGLDFDKEFNNFKQIFYGR